MIYCRRNLYVIIKERDFKKVDLDNNDSFSLCKRTTIDKKLLTKFPDPIQTYFKCISIFVIHDGDCISRFVEITAENDG